LVSAALAADPCDIAAPYLDSVRYRLNGAPYFIDKLLENFLFLGFIARAFSQRKIGALAT
jgi:hypothetical protein